VTQKQLADVVKPINHIQLKQCLRHGQQNHDDDDAILGEITEIIPLFYNISARTSESF